MARPNRIVELDLEEVVTIGLAERKTQPAILGMLNDELRDRYSDEKQKPRAISSACLGRYLQRVGKDTVALAHSPQVASGNARAAMDFEERFMGAMGRIQGMLAVIDEVRDLAERGKDDPDEARSAGIIAALQTMGDHMAVLREHREHLKLWADLMERVYNAKQIERFQRLVMETIAECEPDVAQRIEAKMRESAEARRAALLGMAA